MTAKKMGLIFGALLLLAALGAIFLWQSQARLQEALRANLTLSQENGKLLEEKIQKDSQIKELTDRIGQYEEIVRNMPNFDPAKAAAWQGRGLIPDGKKIAADLVKHPELIPFPAVLGGTMGFYDPEQIYVLTNQWVVAGFEDGHIGGYLLLRYDQKEDQIIWKVLDGYLW